MTLEGRTACLYRGTVTHTRLRPRKHRLRRQIPMVLVDLDELPALDLPLLAVDRFGPLSIEARHHLGGVDTPLKVQVEQLLASEGMTAGGSIRLLCMPAVFGQVFNPLSVYFCHGPDGALRAIVYEVNNTFGGRHCYVLAAEDAPVVRHACAKTFHVSPFLDMDLRYAFTVAQPGAHVALGIEVTDSQGLVLSATFSGQAEPLTNRALAATLARHPLLMMEVLGAIHWEALKMLAKGLRLRPAPRAPRPRPGCGELLGRQPSSANSLSPSSPRKRAKSLVSRKSR